MLRYLVLILLAVNAAFLAWSQGWLKAVIGVQPDAQHEPTRLQQQRHADRITVLQASGGPAGGAVGSAVGGAAESAPASASEAASGAPVAPTPASAASAAASGASTVLNTATQAAAPAGICLQAGPFRNEDMGQVKAQMNAQLSAASTGAATDATPPDTWSTQAVAISGIWLVYMGPYHDEDLYAKKLSELRRIKGLDFDEVSTPPALARGLSLGRYTALEQAQVGLNAMKARGIRTARIVVLRPPADMQLVRVARATQRAQVALSAIKLPQGKAFSACRS